MTIPAKIQLRSPLGCNTSRANLTRSASVDYHANSKADEPVMVKLTLRYDPK